MYTRYIYIYTEYIYIYMTDYTYNYTPIEHHKYPV